MTTTKYVGKQFTIKAGTKVTHLGRIRTRKTDSIVTVRTAVPTRNSRTRIMWKSMGYPTYATV